MNIFMKFVLVAVLGMALPAWADSGSKMLLVYEVINQQPNAFFHFSAYVAAPQFSARSTAGNPVIGSTYSLSNNIIPNAGGIAQLPVVPDNPLPTITALVQTGSQIAQQNYAAIAQAMAAYMAQSGLSSGIFNFQQQVMVQGNPKPGYLIWQMLVDGNGNAHYGDMQFVTNFPILLYGLYTSQAVDASLPATFAYPHAGTLQWEPMQMPNNDPLLGNTAANFTVTPTAGASMQSFTLGGSFDSPQSQNGVSVDADWGLECLINHNKWTAANATALDPACPNVPINGYTDFMTLLAAQGAMSGYLDYVRTLTPVYNQIQQNGQTVSVPQVSVDVTSRTLQNSGFTNCTYNNDGSPWYDLSGQACNGVFETTDETMYGSGGSCTRDTYWTLAAVPSSYTCSNANGNPVVFTALVADPNAQQDEMNANTWYAGNGGSPFAFSATAGQPYLPRTPYAPGATDQTVSGPSPWLWYQQTGGTIAAGVDGNGNPLLYPASDLTTPYVVQRTITTDQWGDSVPGNINIYSLGGNSGPTYTNSGSIGYQVQSVADRYYVTPDGSYVLVGEQTTYPQAPTQSYSYTVTLPNGATPAGYANQIIDPFGTDQVYDYTNDTVNDLPVSAYSVAPIQ